MPRLRIPIAIFGILLFALLGLKWMDTYSLWDDEANTALFAQSVRNTGDTSAILGHNLIAFRGGAELNENQKARYVSPLQYFFLAPFIDPAHPDPFRARLPFLIVTLISLALLYRRLILLNLPASMFLAFACLSVGLTSFLLFGIQARYYALTFLFTLLLAEQYFFSKIEKPFHFFRFGLVSALLFISNYLIGVAVLVCFIFHFIFNRKHKIKKIWAFMIPHFFISAPIFLIWNPLGKNVVELKNSPLDKLNLLFRNVRDFNGGHFGALLLLICGMFLIQENTKRRFRGYGILFLIYLITISLFSPQPVRATGQADIRYLYPLMLLSFVWTLDFFNILRQKNKPIFVATVLAFSFWAIPYSGQSRIHALELVQELFQPAEDPYQLVADELKKIPITETSHPTLLSSLDYASYPLMYASPQFQYIQTEPKVAPDILVDFCDGTIRGGMEQKFSVKYEMLATISTACREAYRPEVFLRSFGRKPDQGLIGIYKKLQ